MAEPAKKPRKAPVRTPASPLMLALSAAERIYKRLPDQHKPKFLPMLTQLLAEPPLFREEAKP